LLVEHKSHINTRSQKPVKCDSAGYLGRVKARLKVLSIVHLGPPTACKSLQKVANFCTTSTLLPDTLFSEMSHFDVIHDFVLLYCRLI